MARQVQGVDGGRFGERIDIEQPVVQIAAKPVDEQDRSALARPFGVPDAADRKVRELVGGTRLLLVLDRGHLERRDIGLDVRIRHGRRRKHTEQRAYRVDLAGHADTLAQEAAVGSLHDIGDLVGLDIHDFVTSRDLDAFLHVPCGKGALLHREAPFRHEDRGDLIAHAGQAPAVLRTASAMRSGEGM